MIEPAPMKKPLIGVTAEKVIIEQPSRFIEGVCHTYLESLQRAEAIPVIIPRRLTKESLEEIFGKIDGLLFPGGRDDIHPSRYGESFCCELPYIDDERDKVESILMKMAIERKKPFLAICRGMQMLNVVSGGTLYQNINIQNKDTIKHHSPATAPRSTVEHDINITPDSMLARIIGATQIGINSQHNQGVKDPAPGLKITALAGPDRIIEAMEVPDHPFGLGVQWHPEELPNRDDTLRLFKALIDASLRHAK